jgi:hypothetical protein
MEVPSFADVLSGTTNTPAKCTTCRFIGKVADFEPADSYRTENEAEWEEKIVLY